MTSTGTIATRPRRVTARKTWLIVHRWLGLTFGLPLVLIGLTGSVLVFDHAIDEWLNPDLLLARSDRPSRPLQDIIYAAEEHQGRSSLSVTKPRIDGGVWTVWFENETANEPTFMAVYVDPPTGNVTGRRIWGQDLLSWIYRLHFRLLAGAPGAVFVGVCGVILAVSVVSGIVLWWPLWRRSWRAALAMRFGPRITYDVHKVFGISSAAFLLVLSFTGVYMEFPNLFRPLITAFCPVTEEPESLSSVYGKVPALTADDAIAIARRLFPDAKFDHLHPPDGPTGVFEVAFRKVDEVQQTFGRTQVFLDQYSGDVLAVRDPRDFTAADAFLAWQFPLHSGEAFGLVGRWCVFFTGLTPAILYVTGCIIWWRRRRAKGRSGANSRDDRTSV